MQGEGNISGVSGSGDDDGVLEDCRRDDLASDHDELARLPSTCSSHVQNMDHAFLPLQRRAMCPDITVDAQKLQRTIIDVNLPGPALECNLLLLAEVRTQQKKMRAISLRHLELYPVRDIHARTGR